jgi:2-amino-4-hydroxy-6-hydroxymethyldihydropteridine diphosphokinase
VTVTYLLLGSNLGNKLQYLHNAEIEISSCVGKIIKKSSMYQSPPWGFKHADFFLNRVLQIETQQTPDELLDTILEIEKKSGRIRLPKSKTYQSREIDIDILFFDNIIINTGKLEIPHPRLHLRKFTLVPLLEITPDLIHPVYKKTIYELLKLCKDNSEVKKLQ